MTPEMGRIAQKTGNSKRKSAAMALQRCCFPEKPKAIQSRASFRRQIHRKSRVIRGALYLKGEIANY